MFNSRMADRHFNHGLSMGRMMDRFFSMQRVHNPDCTEDHGERTNKKLKDQPFFQRQRSGKMKHY